MATTSKSATVELSKAKATPGSVMFLADDDTMPITNLYFRKATLAKLGMDESTEKIKITVEVVS